MLIGFTGRIGSGKDTAGARFANMIDLPSKRISFAAKLKESAAVLLDVPVENFEEWKNDPDAMVFLAIGEYTAFEDDENHIVGPNVIKEFTIREYLQRYGTESHRGVFGQDFWVDQALADIDASDTLYYVTDVRFDNEAIGILDRGGKVFGVIGPDHGGAVAHASEAGINPGFIEYTIKNDARDDQFRKLDYELRYLADTLGLPLKEPELV